MKVQRDVVRALKDNAQAYRQPLIDATRCITEFSKA